MNCAPVSPAMSLSLRAMRQMNFSDSITHGPRMKSGFAPPSVQDPIFKGFGPRVINDGWLSAAFKSCHPLCSGRHNSELRAVALRELLLRFSFARSDGWLRRLLLLS